MAHRKTAAQSGGVVKFLTREQVLEAPDQQQEGVVVEEWGGGGLGAAARGWGCGGWGGGSGTDWRRRW